MFSTSFSCVLFIVCLCACQSARPASASQPEQGGWRWLFDGGSAAAWRGFHQDALPAGWQNVDGSLARVGPGGDIITRETFQDFVLELEWKVAPGGNSGIFFRVTEALDYVWQSGPEMQVLDDALHPDGADPKTSAGANYALHPAARGIVKPAGAWNQVRLEVQGDRVRHVLNGQLVCDYRLGSPEWQALVAQSKFASMPDYGRQPRGHIALQDHGDAVWFRRIRVMTRP